MIEARLFLLQRVSAAVLALFVILHLGIIALATHQGISAAFILGRTRSSLAWPALYTLFTLAAATHGAIGLRAIARETARWRTPGADMAFIALWVLLVALGWRAVAGIA